MSVSGTRSTRPRVRLKESIEVFPASDGALYLLRLGAGDDLVLPDPCAADRALLELLGKGYRTAAGLQAELDRRGLETDVGESLDLLEAAEVLETEPEPDVLEAIDAERLDRQLIYLADLAGPGLSSHDLQRRLLDSTVLLLGCGALGCWAASTLAGAGVGKLVLVDDDRVELSNLNRQILFAEDQLGELKVRAAERSLRAHNHRLDVEGVVLRVRGPSDLEAHLDGVDLVIATADWPPHELPRWVNEACLRASVPYMTAGQFPPRARIGPLVIPGETACLECLERKARREYPLYEELARHRAQGSTPEAAMATTSAVIGALLASEAMHHLMGVESRLASRAMLVDLRTLAVELEEVDRDPDCPLCAPLTPEQLREIRVPGQNILGKSFDELVLTNRIVCFWSRANQPWTRPRPGRPLMNIDRLMPWVWGVIALLFVPLLIVTAGPDSVDNWLAAYWAGAAGGLMLELIGAGWGLEYPSKGKRRPADPRFDPLGPWVDLGFFGRMTTGAVAAPVFLILIKVLLDGLSGDELAATAESADTLAWSVLIGAASPAAWKAGEALVSARLGATNSAMASRQVSDAKDGVSEVASRAASGAGAAEVAVDLGRALGKIESAETLLLGRQETRG